MSKNQFIHTILLHFSHFIKTRPAFLFLLPVFFVLHGFTGNYNSIPADDSLLLVLLYTGCSLIITGTLWLFYRDLIKAGMVAFFIMVYHFFFGNIQDLLKDIFPLSFISQYRFTLPASLVFFLALIIGLKKRKKSLTIFTSYLNMLFLILILIDMGRLTIKIAGNKKNTSLTAGTAGFTVCDTCRKPDIFLILLDQYAGSTALKDVFNFDNTAFQNELTLRGFHIAPQSSSNYNLTPFSMASTLEMDYLTGEMGTKKRLNVGYSYRVIRNSRVLQFLTAQGYRFYNYSVFDFPGQPAHEYGAFLPYGTKLITLQTFTGRLARDIRTAILEGKFGSKSLQKKIAYEYLHYNDTILKLTRDLAANQTPEPKFVYTHLMMPHFPSYFDSKGNPVPLEKLSGFRKTNEKDYVEYLQYGNRKILQLVDHILASVPDPPVIMLLSDHGFRHPGKQTDRKYDFMNLNAVYFPGKNYSGFYDSITNVNHFRVMFNTCFGQQFPLLKDSTIDLWD
jgi:hypothetical protein